MRIFELMRKAQYQVNKILYQGKFSDDAIANAVDTLKGFTDQINDRVSHMKDSWGRYWVREDNTPTQVKVESDATAKGDNTYADANVKLAMIDVDGGCTLTIGTATSTAIAEGGKTTVDANVFSSATGVDLGTIREYHEKGPNYEKAIETLVTLDWDTIYDRNLVFKKHHNIWDRAKKDIGDGNIALAHADVHVEADNGADASTATSTLAIGGELSQAQAEGSGIAY